MVAFGIGWIAFSAGFLAGGFVTYLIVKGK